jgi:hypothetical protein
VDLADGEVSGEGMSTSVLASLRRSLWARVEQARASVGGAELRRMDVRRRRAIRHHLKVNGDGEARPVEKKARWSSG